MESDSKPDPAPDETSQRVRELGEDVEVAILEFLDRHPRTNTVEIRQALRRTEHVVSELTGGANKHRVGPIGRLASFKEVLMNKRLFTYMIAIAGVVWPAGLNAQDAAVLVEGDRVRVYSSESGQACTGDVVARDSESLTVDCWQPAMRKWELIDFSIESVSSLEVQRGTQSNVGKGALLGGLIGGGFGLMVGLAAAANDCDVNAWRWNWNDCWLPGGAEMVPLSTATFGLIGAGAGALIGTLSRSDRWVTIAPSQLRVYIKPARDGFELTFNIAN